MLEMFGSRTAAYAQFEADQADTMKRYNWYAGISAGALGGSAIAGVGGWRWALLCVGVLFGFPSRQPLPHLSWSTNPNGVFRNLSPRDAADPRRLF
jgi:hypothetical protein